jgi:hypothetical protein
MAQHLLLNNATWSVQMLERQVHAQANYNLLNKVRRPTGGRWIRQTSEAFSTGMWITTCINILKFEIVAMYAEKHQEFTKWAAGLLQWSGNMM